MRRVRCYECGKGYDYDDDGFCPGCGAFNTPPSASRIAADGSVVWLDGLNERNHSSSFLHAEIHDEDRERRRLKLDRDPVKETVWKPSVKGRPGTPHVGGRPRKRVSGIIGAIVGIIICVNFLLPLLFALFSFL